VADALPLRCLSPNVPLLEAAYHAEGRSLPGTGCVIARRVVVVADRCRSGMTSPTSMIAPCNAASMVCVAAPTSDSAVEV
jgi:hypothetical protein